MNDNLEPDGTFERRRSNRAILIVVAMALAGIFLNDGVHSLDLVIGEQGCESSLGHASSGGIASR
jgi:hypothetical protein